MYDEDAAMRRAEAAYLYDPREDERHCDSCPCNEDAPMFHRECGEEKGECACYGPSLLGRLRLWWYGPCEVNEDPDCICADYKETDYDDGDAREKWDDIDPDWDGNE